MVFLQGVKMKFSTLFMALLGANAFAQATTWNVDAGHAAIVFKINHLGFSNVFGMIPITEGTITLDEAKPEKTTFEVKAGLDKINTFSAKRD